MKLVLDAGALIALEKGDRAMWTRMRMAVLEGHLPCSHGGVVGQAWRARGPRQALLARALAAVEVRPLDDAAGRAAGALLSKTRGRDVIDAALVLLADDGDPIFTSDPDDIEELAVAAGRDVELISV